MILRIPDRSRTNEFAPIPTPLTKKGPSAHVPGDVARLTEELQASGRSFGIRTDLLGVDGKILLCLLSGGSPTAEDEEGDAKEQRNKRRQDQ